jgi:hypothetical protein
MHGRGCNSAEQAPHRIEFIPALRNFAAMHGEVHSARDIMNFILYTFHESFHVHEAD